MRESNSCRYAEGIELLLSDWVVGGEVGVGLEA